MSSSLPVGERAYQAIKRRLLEAGPAIGTRLDIATLAEIAHVSTTPAREALHRLAAERLVENRAGEGFFVPRPGVGELRRLYRWHARLAAEAASSAREPPVPLDPALTYPMLSAELFSGIAAHAADAEVQRALTNADERLRGFRRAEAAVAGQARTHLQAIVDAWTAGDAAGVRREVGRHARLLAAAAAEILDRAVEPTDGPDIRDIKLE